jgi:predicted site-specific integrase-resolvase
LTLADNINSSSIISDPDSTHGGIYGIDSRHMKRVALYARVSTDAQQKEAIESQLFELKRQIAAAGDVLIKEYITTDIRARCSTGQPLNR